MRLFLSVIVPTFNRVQYLEKVLIGLHNQSLDKRLYEIIIVDNCSTDNTKQLVFQYCNLLNNLNYVYEPKQGLNEARNTGLVHAKGIYIAYLDDDAVPHLQWAKKIVEAFETILPQPGVVGGPTIPIWHGEKPAWLIPKLTGAISMIEYGNTRRFLSGREFLVGANMAFLKNALEQIGGFINGLDRVKNKLISGGDTAAIEKIKKLNYGVFYDFEIAVDHHVQTERLTHKWFIKRYYWAGYSEALMWRILEKPDKRSLVKKMCYYLYGFVRNPSHFIYTLYTPSNPQAFWFKCIVHSRIGYLVGLLNK